MSDALVTYLDSFDGRLLDYLDEDGGLSAFTVSKLRHYTIALLDGTISPLTVDEAWPDWYSLALAFVAAYVPEDLTAMEESVTFMKAAGAGEDAALTEADRVHLRELELYLDIYPEIAGGE